MRIFNRDENDDVVIHKIACEMFNIEAGFQYYDNGVPINAETPKRYPRFEDEGVVTSIRALFGLLILPKNDVLLKRLTREIRNLTKLHITPEGENHLNTLTTLETGSEHFSALRAKNTIGVDSKDMTLRAFITGGPKRSGFYLDESVRFTWIICDMDIFVNEICNWGNSKWSPIWQLVGVLYDSNNVFSFPDNHLAVQQVMRSDINVMKNFRDITFLGAEPRLMDRFNTWIATKNYDILNSDIKALQSIYKEYKNHPNFVISSCITLTKLIICPVRRCGYEIIRHLGNWNIYGASYNFQIFNLCVNEIYDVDFHDIVIDNVADPTKCFNCYTPLYDDIYLIFANKETNNCRAACSICMHSRFSTNESGRLEANNLGQQIYSPTTDVIARTKYPRTVAEVVNSITNIDSTIKDIIMASFGPISTEYDDDEILNQAIYLGIGSGSAVLPDNVYIAWGGTINDYINRFTNPNNLVHRLFGRRFPELYKGGTMFLATLLGPE